MPSSLEDSAFDGFLSLSLDKFVNFEYSDFWRRCIPSHNLSLVICHNATSPAGSRRFCKLCEAAREGNVAPPVDLRYLKKPTSRIGVSSQVRPDVISYLESIYESVAETLPDFRDEAFGAEGNTVDLCGDPYLQELESQAQIPKEKKPRKKDAFLS